MLSCFYVSRTFEFDAAHRIWNHENKCKHLHGHRYVAEVTLRCNGLDECARGIDFGIIKESVGGWINANWDHNILLQENDPFIILLSKQSSVMRDAVLKGKVPYTFALQPTAETLADHLLNRVLPNLFSAYTHVLVPWRVRVYETAKCFVEVCKGDVRTC